MAEFPALPLWTDAYLADCGHLSDAEHGRYFLLLMAMWRAPECRLPNDDEWLARRFRRTIDEIQKSFRPLIAEFCQSTGNWITQKRLSHEHAYVRARSRKRSDAAKSRWEKEKGSCNSNAPTPTPTPTVSEEDKSSSAAIAADNRRKQVFDKGKALLGQREGAFVALLLRHVDDDCDRALDLIHIARDKENPREWLGAVLNRKPAATADVVLAETERLYRELGVA